MLHTLVALQPIFDTKAKPQEVQIFNESKSVKCISSVNEGRVACVVASVCSTGAIRTGKRYWQVRIDNCSQFNVCKSY